MLKISEWCSVRVGSYEPKNRIVFVQICFKKMEIFITTSYSSLRIFCRKVAKLRSVNLRERLLFQGELLCKDLLIIPDVMGPRKWLRKKAKNFHTNVHWDISRLQNEIFLYKLHPLKVGYFYSKCWKYLSVAQSGLEDTSSKIWLSLSKFGNIYYKFLSLFPDFL